MIISLRALKYFIQYNIVCTTCRSFGLGILVIGEGIKQLWHSDMAPELSGNRRIGPDETPHTAYTNRRGQRYPRRVPTAYPPPAVTTVKAVATKQRRGPPCSPVTFPLLPLPRCCRRSSSRRFSPPWLTPNKQEQEHNDMIDPQRRRAKK